MSRRIGIKRRGRHLALQRRDDVVALVDPESDELRELLIEGHLTVQRSHAIADGGSGFIEHEHSSFGTADAAGAASGWVSP